MYRLNHPKQQINKKLISNKGQTNLPSMIQIKVNQSLSVTNQIGWCSEAGEWKWKTQKFQRTQRLDYHGESLVDTGVSWIRPDSHTSPHCSCVFLSGNERAEKGAEDLGEKYNLWRKVKVLELFRIRRLYTLGLIGLFSLINFYWNKNYEINIELLQFTECLAWTRWVTGILKYIFSSKPYSNPIALSPFCRTGNGSSETLTGLVKYSYEFKVHLLVHNYIYFSTVRKSLYFLTISLIRL